MSCIVLVVSNWDKFRDLIKTDASVMTGLSAVPPQWDPGQIDLLLTLTDIIVGS